MPSSRTVVRWMSLLVAVIGWGVAFGLWAFMGDAAGIDPGFIIACSLGICFSIIWARAWSDDQHKDEDRVFGLGVCKGIELAADLYKDQQPVEAGPRLRAVR